MDEWSNYYIFPVIENPSNLKRIQYILVYKQNITGYKENIRVSNVEIAG
jgi:hypothetical protein